MIAPPSPHPDLLYQETTLVRVKTLIVLKFGYTQLKLMFKIYQELTSHMAFDIKSDIISDMTLDIPSDKTSNMISNIISDKNNLQDI
jgi:hypothetical protein